ncbi:sensor histidine kinase [Kocuria sp. HSID16901]|uniref:sensor histidine kinase n=1 Tax=Kocuria sp. HSID16901 TaxID=2419505 RepID=UPI0006602351|nr:histidine kinase [Kocuria sp. HSID16901]RUQ22464.1 two-component sensor histidine kinase [Kocuria sp. HSID16901]
MAHHPKLAALNGWLNDPEAPEWIRPRPGKRSQRADVLLAVVLAVLSFLLTGLMQSFGGPLGESTYSPVDYGAAVLMPLGLLFRRRFPLVTLMVATVLFLGLSTLSPAVATSWIFQACYFSAIYTAVAWAPHRRRTWIVVGLVVVGFLALIAVPWMLQSTYETGLRIKLDDTQGPLDPVIAYAMFSALVNVAYLCGAALFGRSSWKGALRRSRLAEQTRTIESQTRMLTRQAIVEDRLRLARDLHDSVGHHFTGVGLQAGGVRRIVERSVVVDRVILNEEQTSLVKESLQAIESSTKKGIGELQTVLRVLRAEDEDNEGGPEAFRDLPAMLEHFEELGLTTRLWISGDNGLVFDELAEHPSAEVRRGLYLMIQEALNNVLKHSVSREAKLAVKSRRTTQELEVQILDAGPARAATSERLVSSSGAGIRGIEERVTRWGGHIQYGPSSETAGWTISWTIPWPVSWSSGEDSE